MKSFKSHLKILVLFIGALLSFNNAYAIGYMLHDDSVLELQIAKNSPTRISIEGEKINDIMIHPKEAAEIIVHDSGCIFVLPQQGKNKVYISIVAESGIVQDLLLSFTKDKPSPIRLLKYNFKTAETQQLSKYPTNQNLPAYNAYKIKQEVKK
ncbi:TraK domain-containing protein [Rickettsia fournieri]|uniref:TraK domain-containing protein n=1 Tax=Rickettsia fournieri TaxID=1436798 RepID=UPI000CDF02AA|nr:type-F conjugative transfer system secretin TraK [Rickettsia fournieri]